MKIGILIPVCSRNQNWARYEDCYLATVALPSLLATISQGYDYRFYIGVDDDDAFFQEHLSRLPGTPVVVENCANAPAHVWNHLCQRAVVDGCEYVFQMADDVVMETPRWTERFIAKLQENKNRGVVGPCHLENYHGRLREGKPFVLENAFVHRSHFDTFGFFYPWEIRNWYCDDWITRVYEGTLSYMFKDITVKNLSIRTGTQRYAIAHPDWKTCLAKGRARLRQTTKGCFSFCLYGEYTDKYSKGLQVNVDILRTQYPNWDIVVYAAPEAEEFVRSLGVKCIPTGKTGVVNTIYRFLPMTDATYDVVCVRDTDSRVHPRDRWCIDNFLDSTYSLYTIRDHPWHRYRIMCGLWGSKRGHGLDEAALRQHCEKPLVGYTSDSIFLETHLRIENFVVYSYDPTGLFNDPTENYVWIDCPGDFCGNVILFDQGVEVPQFTRYV